VCDATRVHAGAMAQHLGAVIVDDSPASLDEIFVAYAAGNSAAAPAMLDAVS
jgi:hypothetical protein